MAEQIRLYIEINITENNLKKLLNSKFEIDPYKKKLGYYFSKLLYDGAYDSANLFILNFDKKKDTCFIAYAPKYFENSIIDSFLEIFKIMSHLKNEDTIDYVIIVNSFPEFIEGYTIQNKNVKKINPNNKPNEVVEKLHQKFWSFSKNNSFPSPDEALNKRNYLYKNFKSYYKRFLIYMEACEKPNHIKKATKEEPFHLFDDFYTFDNKVFEFKKYTNQIIEIPKACPLTFNNKSGLITDKNYVFLPRLAKGSPPENIKQNSFTINNPNAIWEYYIFEGADGESFNYIKEKWDTIYYKDKNAIYSKNTKTNKLESIKQVDYKTFEYLGFCFGKDKSHLFYYHAILPINSDNFTLDKYGFIFDAKNIFHFQHKIPLDAVTFRVVQIAPNSKQFDKTYILEDKNGKYEYSRKWKNEIVKPILNP